MSSDARPTNDILIECEIQFNLVKLLFITYSADHNGIIHTLWQQHYCDMCNISLWSIEHILNQITAICDRIMS